MSAPPPPPPRKCSRLVSLALIALLAILPTTVLAGHYSIVDTQNEVVADWEFEVRMYSMDYQTMQEVYHGTLAYSDLGPAGAPHFGFDDGIDATFSPTGGQQMGFACKRFTRFGPNGTWTHDGTYYPTWVP